MSRKKVVTIDAALRALAEAKLASSGLDLKDAELLGFQACEAVEVIRALGTDKYPYRAIRLPYYDPAGHPILDGGQPYARFRFLDAPKPDASKELLTGKKEKAPRYIQPAKSGMYPYYPKNQAWPELLADPDQTLIITEGEFKAAKACKEGFPTIGLGGVWNWRNLNKGITLLPLLAEPWVHWAGRKVIICFDSDYTTNPQVCAAIQALAEELGRQGAEVHVATLPSLPEVEGKVGLDDFLTFGGSTAATDLEQKLAVADPLGLTKPLFRLNRKYCYVKDPGFMVDREARFKVSPTAFTQHLESTSLFYEGSFNSKGVLVRKEVPAAAAWLKWPLRTTATCATYLPGGKEFEGQALNLWPGWGCEPKKGDEKPFVALLDHLFEGAEPKAKEWFIRWLAYPLQHPGAKLFTAAVMHGHDEGTGKSLVGYTMARIYGKNFASISQKELQGSFNEWAAEKQFVMGDDVTGTDRYESHDHLKKLITQEMIRINVKHVASYDVPDCINYFFTTNRPDSFMMGDKDRRMFIHEVLVAPLPKSFYNRYRDWLKGEGPSAVFHYLLHYDLGDWDPSDPAPRTAAKERMIADVRSALGDWIHQLKINPDEVTQVGQMLVDKDLFTAKELRAMYDPDEKTKVTYMGLARELRAVGFPLVLAGQQVRTKDGAQNRYYVVRNHEHWARCKTTKEVGDYLDSWQPTTKRRKF